MPQTIRCKFRCNFINKLGGTAYMAPVIGDVEANDKFFNLYPHGLLMLSMLDAPAIAQLEQGRDYYLDITRVP